MGFRHGVHSQEDLGHAFLVHFVTDLHRQKREVPRDRAGVRARFGAASPLSLLNRFWSRGPKAFDEGVDDLPIVACPKLRDAGEELWVLLHRRVSDLEPTVARAEGQLDWAFGEVLEGNVRPFDDGRRGWSGAAGRPRWTRSRCVLLAVRTDELAIDFSGIPEHRIRLGSLDTWSRIGHGLRSSARRMAAGSWQRELPEVNVTDQLAQLIGNRLEERPRHRPQHMGVDARWQPQLRLEAGRLGALVDKRNATASRG